MNKKTIDFELLSKERENIFDDYHNTIEHVKLNDVTEKDGEENYDLLTYSLTILERNIDDLASEKKFKDNEFVQISELIIQCLKEWLPIFRILIKEPNFILSFSYNLQGIAILVSQCKNWTILDLQKDLIFFSPSRKDRISFNKKNKIGLIHGVTSTNTNLKNSFSDVSSQLTYILNDKSLNVQQIIYKISELSHTYDEKNNLQKIYYSNDENILILANQIYENFSTKIFPFIDFEEFEKMDIEKYRQSINKFQIHPIIENFRLSEDYYFEWDIEVIINDELFSSSQIGFLMWTISKALESIDGVKVFLDDWGNGSKRFNLKLIIEDLLAKEEVKQVLDKSRKAIEDYYIDKPIEEVDSIITDKEKSHKETSTLLSKNQIDELHNLEVQKKSFEVNNLKIELELKKLKLLKGYSDLIKDGIITNDSDFQIKINDILFIKKEEQLSIGENIDIISEKEIKHKKDNSKSENP